MQLRFTWLLALALAVPAVSLADAKSELQAIYVAITKSFQAKDIGGATKYLAPDFSVDLPDGRKADRKGLVDNYKQQMNQMSNATWDRKVTKTAPKGKDTLAYVDGLIKADVKDLEGKIHKFEMSTSIVDTWSKGAKGWMLKHTKVIKREMKVDGKVQGGG